MPFSVRAADLAFQWPGGAGLSIDDLTLRRGWTAVVGANGAGKSTLLRLLAGELAPHAGAVRRPPGLRIHHCPQRIDDPDAAVHGFAWAWDGEALRLRSRLGLDPEALARWPTLSPGERKRWQIGAALYAEPGLLLLDEPTNHLDGEGRAALEAALRDFGGIGVVVSHDRALLDALAEHTMWVADGRVHAYAGGYAAARAARQAAHQAEVARVTAAQQHARAQRAQWADARRAQAAAGAALSSRNRMRGPRDRDARSAGAKARVRHAEAQHGARTGRLRTAASRASQAAADHDLRAPVGAQVWVAEGPPAPPTLVRWQADALRAGSRVLLRGVDLAVQRGERIWLQGPNGAGKTTLIHALLAARRWPEGRLLWLPQHLSPEAVAQAQARLAALPPEDRGRVLARLAALGVPPDRVLGSARPSPGEARLLLLAEGLGQAPWLVALDEPTNHLALPTRERLEDALTGFEGALLLVTHDPDFAAATTRIRWRISGREVRVESP